MKLPLIALIGVAFVLQTGWLDHILAGARTGAEKMTRMGVSLSGVLLTSVYYLAVSAENGDGMGEH
jgi:hypothetical protein